MEMAGGGEAIARVLGHGAAQDSIGLLGQVRARLPQAGRRLHDVLERQRDRRVGLVRHAAGEHLVGNHAQGVQIGPPVDVLDALGLFRAHVGGRPVHGRRAQIDVGVGDLGKAEVGDIRVLVAVEKDVGRFEIAVDDAGAMSLIECGRQLTDDPERLREWQRPELEAVRQASAGHVPHHQIRLPVVFAEVMDRHDRGVFERGDGLSFTQEARFEARVMQQLTWQHLDRDVAVEVGVARAVDDGHAATPDLAQNLVAPDLVHARPATRSRVRSDKTPLKTSRKP